MAGNMKARLLLTLAGLAMGFALPGIAQQKDTVDPQILEQLAALGDKTDEAFNDGDAAALAALYTQDAVLVTETGPIYGREAIERHYAITAEFQYACRAISRQCQSSLSGTPEMKP
jgi:hypothetical protein